WAEQDGSLAMQSLNSVAHSASYHPRPSGAPDVGHAHHDRGAASVLSADASAQALRSCRGCSAALLTPTQPGIRDTSAIGRIGALDSPNPAGGPVTRLTHQHPSGGPIRVQHDIQPGAIDTGVTAIVALRLDAGRTGRVEAMNRQKEAPLRQTTEQTGTSGRWLWVGGMDAADLADHNQRPDRPTVAAKSPQSLITSPRREHQMQTPRFTTVIVEKAEDLLDYIRDAASDNHICDVEIRTIDLM